MWSRNGTYAGNLYGRLGRNADSWSDYGCRYQHGYCYDCKIRYLKDFRSENKRKNKIPTALSVVLRSFFTERTDKRRLPRTVSAWNPFENGNSMGMIVGNRTIRHSVVDDIFQNHMILPDRETAVRKSGIAGQGGKKERNMKTEHIFMIRTVSKIISVMLFVLLSVDGSSQNFISRHKYTIFRSHFLREITADFKLADFPQQ